MSKKNPKVIISAVRRVGNSLMVRYKFDYHKKWHWRTCNGNPTDEEIIKRLKQQYENQKPTTAAKSNLAGKEVDW